ncbi:MAG: toxin [bacterium]
MLKYKYQETKQFSESIENIKGQDLKRIQKTIDRLLDTPDLTDGPYHGEHRGKFKKYVGKSGFLLVYTWCERCIKNRLQEYLNCAFCGTISEKSVIFFDVVKKADAYKNGY